MYVGRFVVITPEVAAYRVSSRSYPHREIIEHDDALAVVPTDEAAPTDNPYVSYHCLRIGEEAATIGNGSHVDHIAEKLELGYPERDALTMALLALDFERDDYDTPRLAAILSETPTIGIVRRDGVIVREIDEPTLVATYEIDEPRPTAAPWNTAAAAAQGVYEFEYEHPVCAAGVERTVEGFTTAIYNGPEDADPC